MYFADIIPIEKDTKKTFDADESADIDQNTCNGFEKIDDVDESDDIDQNTCNGFDKIDEDYIPDLHENENDADFIVHMED